MKEIKTSDRMNKPAEAGDTVPTAVIKEKCSKIISVFSTDILEWLGSLFDGEMGGFYYSTSARNDDEFLPDIESTAQAIELLFSLIGTNDYKKIPEWIRKRIACFISSCEDESDGFFYTSLYPKALARNNMSKRGRDLNGALWLSKVLSFNIPFPHAEDRLLSNADAQHRFSSVTSFKEYLGSLSMKLSPNEAAHAVVCQSKEIIASGLAKIASEHLVNTYMKGDNGVFESEISATTLNVYNAIVIFHTRAGIVPPNLLRQARCVIQYTRAGCFTDELASVSNVYSSLNASLFLLRLSNNKRDKVALVRLKKEISDALPILFDSLHAQLLEYRRSDGSFGYNKYSATEYCIGEKKSNARHPEGDVNGSLIAVSTVKHLLDLANVNDTPIFGCEALSKFISAIKRPSLLSNPEDMSGEVR